MGFLKSIFGGEQKPKTFEMPKRGGPAVQECGRICERIWSHFRDSQKLKDPISCVKIEVDSNSSNTNGTLKFQVVINADMTGFPERCFYNETPGAGFGVKGNVFFFEGTVTHVDEWFMFLTEKGIDPGEQVAAMFTEHCRIAVPTEAYGGMTFARASFVMR